MNSSSAERNSILGNSKDGNSDDRTEGQAMPDVSSDRAPAPDAEPEGAYEPGKTAPLGIKDIENLEDDSKGG